MTIKAGLVGLPNVGKSTLFNALTKSCVPAENYPFCTIEPHVAVTPVPDERIEKLQQIYGSQKLIPATVSFADIAGLVKGAATGAGLGNQFLSHIRQTDVTLHVLRCFQDANIIRDEPIDPLDDFETIVAELMLKDIESCEKRQAKLAAMLKGRKGTPDQLKTYEIEQKIIERLIPALQNGDYENVQKIARDHDVSQLFLLSTKPFLIIANISEADVEGGWQTNEHVQALMNRFGNDVVIPVCARIEYELTQVPEAEAQELMAMYDMSEPGLHRIIRQTYTHLGLITFFTCGPKEIHAWPIRSGMTVRQAAGEIHSDLQRGFICADVFNYEDLIKLGSEQALKTAGKIRTEGQDYAVQDGDIIHVKFNV